MLTTVFNLTTYNEIEYTCSARQAVIAAYAQSKNDWNTWNYEKNYGSKIRLINGRTWLLGDFTAIEKG